MSNDPSRNYNLNRPLDAKTQEFEEKLQALLDEYEAEMQTESFPQD